MKANEVAVEKDKGLCRILLSVGISSEQGGLKTVTSQSQRGIDCLAAELNYSPVRRCGESSGIGGRRAAVH